MAPPHKGEVITAACPLFHFIGALYVTISDLIINCETTSDTLTAPAILFEQSAVLSLEISNVMAYGWARATILVTGGIFNVVPPTGVTVLSGNATNISVSRTDRYIDAQAIVLTEFTGTFDVFGLANFTEITINPAPGGSLNYSASARLDITNMAEISNIEGRPITSEFDTNGDINGLTAAIENSTMLTLAKWLAYALLFMVALALALHQDFYARYRDKVAMQAAGSNEHAE